MFFVLIILKYKSAWCLSYFFTNVLILSQKLLIHEDLILQSGNFEIRQIFKFCNFKIDRKLAEFMFKKFLHKFVRNQIFRTKICVAKTIFSTDFFRMVTTGDAMTRNLTPVKQQKYPRQECFIKTMKGHCQPQRSQLGDCYIGN